MRISVRKSLIFSVPLVVTALVLLGQPPAELSDDGAFFFRYAENMLRGRIWVWNQGEAPVWGASAPFWPVLLALPLGLTGSPLASAICVGTLFFALGLAILFLRLATRISLPAAGAMLLFALLNTSLKTWVFSGMETPMTLLLWALCAAALLGRPSAAWVGVLAGALMVHKLDLLPIGALFIGCAGWSAQRISWRSVWIAAACVVGWHGFAWVYFGYPLPNAFLSRLLHQESLPASWFSTYVFLHNGHLWMSAAATGSILVLWRQPAPHRALWLFATGTLVAHTAAYTVHPPLEPYTWYAMPAVFALVCLAALGVHSVAGLLPSSTLQHAACVLLALGFARMVYVPEQVYRQDWNAYLEQVESGRADAGRWVAANTPDDMTMLTGWGNPALYARRTVIDASFLNAPYTEVDLIETHQPDLIAFQGDSGSTADAPSFRSYLGDHEQDYIVVETFGRSPDTYFGVMVRRDRLDQIRVPEPGTRPEQE